MYLYMLYIHFVNYCREKVSSKITGWVVITSSRNSQQRCSTKKAVIKIFAIFTGKRYYTGNFINKSLQNRCFPVNVMKILRASILKDIWKCLLLLLLK